MCNVIVNELGIWDAVFLKTRTNAPYLIGPDEKYVRDGETGKPLVWDNSDGKAKPYDARNIPDYATACTVDYALLGEYTVKGVRCHPAFQLIKEHLKQYTPEMASKISTVPAATIRRLATEFAQAAQIGSTITVDGYQLPFRPASAIVFRGGQGHENSYHTCFAIALLNMIVGGGDVPGGTLGWPARSLGYPATGKLAAPITKGKDGFMEIHHFGPAGKQSVVELVRGSLAPVLWVGVVVCGIILPVSISISSSFAGTASSPLLIVAIVSEMVGAFSLKYCILKAGIYAPLIPSSAT